MAKTKGAFVLVLLVLVGPLATPALGRPKAKDKQPEASHAPKHEDGNGHPVYGWHQGASGEVLVGSGG